MGNVTAGYVFSAGETVTPTKLNALFGGSNFSVGSVQVVSIPISPQFTTQVATADVNTPPTTANGFQIFSGAIVPRDTSSKVMVQFSITAWGAALMGQQGVPLGLALFRGTTLIAWRVFKGWADADEQLSYDAGFCFLDSPASAASVTYSARLHSVGTNLPIGVNNNFTTDFPGGPAVLIEYVGVA
jgi:hypothetical protein